jgi:type IV pilus assembly protein PilF
VRPDRSTTQQRWCAALFLATVLTSCATWTENAAKKDELANIHLQLGLRYLDMNKLEVANENLQLALEEEPNNALAHNVYAFLYEKLNDYERAKAQYEKALNLAPDDWNIQNNYGRFLCDRGDYKQGMELLTQAISTQLNDRQWLALTNAGRCQLAMKQAQSAKAYFKQALILNNAYAPTLLEMQKLSYQSGDYWAAKGYLQRYLSVAEHTSGTLWFGMQTERALGNTELAKEYQNLLLEKFPLSDEAKQIKPVLH